jgi:hypothetical protein
VGDRPLLPFASDVHLTDALHGGLVGKGAGVRSASGCASRRRAGSGRPSLLPYDAMSYLVFFPDGDAMNRDFEWWTGALAARAE